MSKTTELHIKSLRLMKGRRCLMHFVTLSHRKCHLSYPSPVHTLEFSSGHPGRHSCPQWMTLPRQCNTAPSLTVALFLSFGLTQKAFITHAQKEDCSTKIWMVCVQAVWSTMHRLTPVVIVLTVFVVTATRQMIMG